jgi:hypothetical protein
MEITKWMEKVITCLKRSKPLAGRGIVIEETPLGSRIHLKAIFEAGGAQESPVYYCKVTGRLGIYYTVNIYNRMNGSITGTRTALPLQLLFSETIPNGTPIITFEMTTETLS